jgi:hypothetical protein
MDWLKLGIWLLVLTLCALVWFAIYAVGFHVGHQLAAT